MTDQFVLVPSTSSTTSECYHLPYDHGDPQPYCTPSEEYERISLQTVHALNLRLCRRCAHKNGPAQNTIADTTCPFCTEAVMKTRFPHHLQNCPEAP